MKTSDFFEMVDQVFHDWKYDHPRILYSLIRALKPSTVLEIGTYRGYAAAWMAQALLENGKGHLYCIDDFSEGMQKKYDKEHWEENLTKLGVRHLATLVIGKSEEVAWPLNIDFAYIDGWHSYHTTSYDFFKSAALGATCICLDDVKSTIGPSKLIQEIHQKLYPGWVASEIFSDCGLAVCTRQPLSRPCVDFSQELAGPGTVMTGWSLEQRKEHLKQCSAKNNDNYLGYDFGWE